MRGISIFGSKEGASVGRHGHREAGESRGAILGVTLVLVLAAGAASLLPTILRASHDGSPSSSAVFADDESITRTFQKGDGGAFGETDDTYISSGAPSTNFGAGAKLLVDGSGCKTSVGTVCKVLIAFPWFIGPDPAQVPPGAAIVNANLKLMVTNTGVTEDVYEVTQSWSEATVTWNSFSPPGSPETRPRESIVSPSSLGLFPIDITTIVQRWVDGELNDGILLASTHWDGVDYESSESTNRPILTVQFNAAAPPPPSSYAIHDLGVLPGDYHPGGRAINAVGDAVGLSYGSADDYIHGILWKDGTATYLGDLGGGQSYATAINDAGRVVGSSCKYPGDAPPACNFYYGFVWKNGTMSSLPTLFYGGTTGATGINDGGQVVGSASAPPYGYDHAALWENGNVTDLGTLGGYYSGATAINDAGQVVGSGTTEGNSPTHPFLWADGVMTDLGTLGGPNAFAKGINDAGQIVGYSEVACNGCSHYPVHAFLWADGAMTDLGTLGGENSYAYGISDAGRIVGGSFDANGLLRAFVWQDGTMADLGTLGGNYGSAYAINQAGQIVGESSDPSENLHAVVWTTSAPSPPPGPSTLAFQNGDGGAFSATDDTYISSGAPGTNFGTAVNLFVDASGCHVGSSVVCKSLIKFPDFIGPSAGQVTPGSTVVSATLEFTITNPSGGTQLLYQLTEAWTESGATWHAFTVPGSPAVKGSGISFTAALGVVRVNITAIVQNWVKNGDANFGLFIWSSSTDGVDYRSSESVNPPKLIVTFRSP